MNRASETAGPARSIRPAAVIAVPMALAALYAWALFVSVFTAPGTIGPNFNAPGTDWMVFHRAARAALDGHIAEIFDGDRFTTLLNASYSNWLTSPLPFRPWVYPPGFLLLVLPFAALGFLASYVLFQLLGALLLAGALKLLPGPTSGKVVIAAVLLSPAAIVNVIDGQLAFLIAAICVAGFAQLEKHPWLAGAMLGLLTIKPQFAVMAPLALVAAGAWRPLAAATLSGVALTGASALAFGIKPWLWWWHQALASMSSPDPKWIEYGRVWGNSVYTCAVLLGAPDRIASMLQAISVLACAAAVIAAFRSHLPRELKLSLLLIATVLAAPHSGAYDALLLVISGFLWIGWTGNAVWHWIVMLVLWMVPIISPPAVSPPGRLVPFVLVGLLVTVLYQHASSRGRLRQLAKA